MKTFCWFKCKGNRIITFNYNLYSDWHGTIVVIQCVQLKQLILKIGFVNLSRYSTSIRLLRAWRFITVNLFCYSRCVGTLNILENNNILSSKPNKFWYFTVSSSYVYRQMHLGHRNLSPSLAQDIDLYVICNELSKSFVFTGF